MPQGDGTGPRRDASGRGRGQGGGAGLGSGGYCICLSCGEKVVHQRGVPCFENQCPKCGSMLTRANPEKR